MTEAISARLAAQWERWKNQDLAPNEAIIADDFYLAEMCFRFNNRKNDFLLRDTVINLNLSPNLEYKNRTAKLQDAL